MTVRCSVPPRTRRVLRGAGRPRPDHRMVLLPRQPRDGEARWCARAGRGSPNGSQLLQAPRPSLNSSRTPLAPRCPVIGAVGPRGAGACALGRRAATAPLPGDLEGRDADRGWCLERCATFQNLRPELPAVGISTATRRHRPAGRAFGASRIAEQSQQRRLRPWGEFVEPAWAHRPSHALFSVPPCEPLSCEPARRGVGAARSAN
jgi:hypothetical protein